MPIQYPDYLALILGLLAVAVVTGLFLYRAARKFPRAKTKRVRVAEASLDLVVLVVLLALVEVAVAASTLVSPVLNLDFTPGVYSVEGEAAGRIQSALQSPPMTEFMKVVYIGGFSFILAFTPALLVAYDLRGAMQRLALSAAVFTAFIIPFYILFPVYVSSYSSIEPAYLATMETPAKPLLYSDPNAYQFIFSINRPDDAFPSVHTGLTVVILLVVWKYTDLSGYLDFLLVMAVLVPLSSVYLGVHWLADIAAGAAIASLSFLIAETTSLSARYEKASRRIGARAAKAFAKGESGNKPADAQEKDGSKA